MPSIIFQICICNEKSLLSIELICTEESSVVIIIVVSIIIYQLNLFWCNYFMTFQGEDNEELTFVVIPNTVAEVKVIFLIF